MNHEVISKLLRIASNQIGNDFNNYTKKFGLTGHQLMVINFLYAHQGQRIYPRDIKKMLLVKRSTVSVLIHRMEIHGLINRHTDEKDARLKRITLTDKALRIRNIVNDGYNAEIQKRHSPISEEESHQLINLLNKLIYGGNTSYGKY